MPRETGFPRAPGSSGAEQQRIRRVELRGIVKRFPGVLANDHVDFDVTAGEVHALLGENGAGKSTLMRQLYGMYQPDEGQILIDGQPQLFHSPADAIRAGIGMIHQHFMLVPTLTVAENVALGLPSSRGPLLDLDQVSQRVRDLSKGYGLKVDPSCPVWQLSVGEQQRVEIVKALYRGASVIILDEPTAVLTPQEVDDLFITLRRMVGEGHALVFISHKLHEVMAISDRVTALRDGKLAGTRQATGATRAELAHMMVGREVKPLAPQPLAAGPLRLQIQGLRAHGRSRHRSAAWGRAGSPRRRDHRPGRCLGQRTARIGPVSVRPAQGRGRHGRYRGPGHDARVAAGAHGGRTGLHPRGAHAGRCRSGISRSQENLFLHEHASPAYTNWRIFLNFAKMAAHARRLVADYAVKTPRLDTPLKNLSGGNIQKLILARELSRKPKILIAAQPTRGVDIGATQYIHERLLEQRAHGTAILLISEDLDEIRTLSDRIAVMYEGRIIGIVERDQASVEQIGLMMAGVSMDEALQRAA